MLPRPQNYKKSLSVSAKWNDTCAKRLVALFSVCSGLVGLTACGNNWMSSKDREKSPSAMMLQGEKLYDKGDFAGAIRVFNKLLQEDPNNERARLRLAYCYNGLAGLTPFDLILKLSDSATTSPAKSGAASGGTATSASSSANAMAPLIKIAGLTNAQQVALGEANPSTYQDLLTADVKFASLAKTDPSRYQNLVATVDRLKNLQLSWTTVCRMIPKRILDTVVASNNKRKINLSIDKCLGGENSVTQSPAVLFAAAMESLAQGVAIYQVKLDSDGDGTVDAVKVANTLSTEIRNLNSQASSSQSADEITNNLRTLNEKMAQLDQVGKTLSGELVDLAFAHFEIMALLLTAIKDVMPENVANSLIKGVKKFEESKTLVSGYVKTSSAQGTSKTSSSTSKVLESLSKSSEAANKYYQNFDKSNASAEKQAEFNTQFKQTCNQFDAVKGTFGLPSSVQKPANCTSANLAEVGAYWVAETGALSSSHKPQAELLHTEQDLEQGEEFRDLDSDFIENLVEFSRLGEVWLKQY